MKRLLLCIALALPALAAAAAVSVTVTAPSQQLTVQPQATVVTPETITVEAVINVTGTSTVEIAVPGPQGIPGATTTGEGGGGTWGSIIGTLGDQLDLQAALDDKAGTGHGHIPTHYAPATMTIITGAWSAGNVASLAAIDNNIARINEVIGTPGYNIEIGWSGVTTFNKFQLHEQYSGGVTHDVQIDLYNWQTASWQILETINSQTAMMAKSYDVINAANYINAGQVKARLYHASPGNASHYLLLDYVSIKDDYSTGVAEHGALTSLLDDDHLQYLTGTRHGAITGNPHATSAAQVGAEPALGNPATSGWLLSSLTNGSRSWTRPLEACVDVYDGAPGATGAAGADGAPGPANELAIGTVTTGDPGTDAAATITGTPPSQTLSLVIPRGDPGPAANITQSNVLAALDDPTTDAVLWVQAGVGETATNAKSGTKDSSGNARQWVDGNGTVVRQCITSDSAPAFKMLSSSGATIYTVSCDNTMTFTGTVTIK